MPDLPAAKTLAEDCGFLTFRVGERRYALPTKDVSEVVRLPPVARLPLSPKPLMGLVNLRGSVLPVVSLPAVLGRPAAGAGSTRAIILAGTNSAALVVDAVERVVAPEQSRIETRQAELAAEPGEQLVGVFSLDGEHDAAGILDIRGMLSNAFSRQAGPRQPVRSGAVAMPRDAAAQQTIDWQVLVTFDAAGQEYALPLESVQEIVSLPPTVSLIPRAEAVLLGVIAYRDQLLPLLSLRVLLGFSGADDFGGREKVIVTPVNGVLVGLVADQMKAIVRANPALIEPTPAMLAARTGGEARIKAMYRADDGRRLISILSPQQLFREDVVRRLGDPSSSSVAPSTAERLDHAETVQFLIFRLGEEAFGLPIAAIDEVARVPDNIARIPNAPNFLEGVVNLRGDVLPVIDQRKRFGLAANTGHGRQRMVVVRTDGHRAGLIVDSVSEVLRWSPDLIESAPDLIGEINRLVSGVVNLEEKGQMVLLLDPAELLSQAEHGLLDKFAAEAADQAES